MNAKFLPRNLNPIIRRGMLIRIIEVPIGRLLIAFVMMAKPAVPPVAILFGAKKVAIPSAIIAEPIIIKAVSIKKLDLMIEFLPFIESVEIGRYCPGFCFIFKPRFNSWPNFTKCF